MLLWASAYRPGMRSLIVILMTVGTAGRLKAGLFALGLGGGTGVAIIAAVIGFSGSSRGVEAQGPAGDVTACVRLYTGHVRMGWQGRQLTCSAGEFALLLGSGESVANLEERLNALEEQVPACVSEDDNADAVFEACNVRVISGSGATNGAVNGKGNLIVGYDESVTNADWSDSHNLIVGSYHTYSSYAGLVAGIQSTFSGA